MSGYEDLLAQATSRLSELEEGNNDSLGDRIELEEGGHFMGRYRGVLTMFTSDGEREVYGFWGQKGERRFHYQNAGLRDEMAEADPDVGDVIVLVRGDDYAFEVNGEQRTKFKFAVRCQPSDDPLPAETGKSAAPAAKVPDDSDIPF